MPYTIRKVDCKQSDGTSGSYTLSYTDNKGKKHRACHTSKKKAKGQIAAIEMESIEKQDDAHQVNETTQQGKSQMKIQLSQLRKYIREALQELSQEQELEEDEFTFAIANAAAKGEKTADIDGEKFPVKMSKEKAKDILKNQK